MRLPFIILLALLAFHGPGLRAEETPPEPPPAPSLSVESETPVTTGMALLEKLRQGGVTIALLLGVSVFGAACTLERLVHLRQSRIAPRPLARKLELAASEGRYGEIGEMTAPRRSTLARVVSTMGSHRNLAVPELSTLAGDVASREMRTHLLRAYPLMICATISPLLGLFGTVAGMIGAFDKVAAAGSLGDASMLGGDISKALITTAAGLVVAMPTLALYHYFRSRTNLLAIVLEEQVGGILTHWRPSDPFETTPAP